jgi:hypothetical protein
MANGYKKVGGGARPGRLAITQISLWQGSDHLLQVEKDGYSERYRRFYFADIESFIIRRDNRQRNYTIALIILQAFFLFFIVIGGSSGMRVALSIPFAMLLTALIVNIAKGPSCVTHVTTAVQRQEIQSLRRVRAAERAANEILNGSQATQGLLSPEETRMRFELRSAPPIPGPPPAPPNVPLDLPPAL